MMEPIKVFVKEGETTKLALKSPTEKVTLEKHDDRSSCKPLGACSFCHQLLMLLNLKRHLIGEQKFLFDVCRINVSRAPSEFRQNCFRNVPAVIDPNTETSSDNDLDIIEYLDQQYPTPALDSPVNVEDLRVVKICSNIFKKFKQFITTNTSDSAPLLNAIQVFNDYLVKNGNHFIYGNTITTFDTEIMPKLHQLRIACSYIRSLDLPADLVGIWSYLYRAYHCPAFVQWCPSDQEIVIAWTAKASLETPSMKLNFDEKKRLIKSEPSFTFSMPNEEFLRKISQSVCSN